MKKIMLTVALMVSVMAVNVATAAVSLKSSGDQWGPAVQDLMNAKENGNWNESRFISTFNSRFNGTAEEAKALLDSLKAGNIPQSAESFNNSISTPNPGNGNGNSGGSTCTGNPHNCNSGVTKDELDASQKAQDDKQAVVDNAQDDKLADHDSRIKDLEDNKPTNGKDGVDGQKGEKGDTGAAGKDGKDADMTFVNQNTSDISDLKATKADNTDLNKEVNDRKSADQNLQNQINANNLHDVIQDAAIVGLAVTKADKADLNKESAERKAADVALNGKIDQAVSNQAIVDKAQNTAIGNAQTSSNNAQNTANVALGVGIANSIGLAAESSQREAADTALNNKVDKNKADQKVTDDAQNAAISTKADKTALDKETTERKASDAVLGGAIIGESIARAAGDAALNNKINQNAANQLTKDKAQDAAINGKVDKTQYDKDKSAQASTDAKQNDHINAVQDAAQTANDRATDLEHRADASENAIRETNKQLEVTDQRSIDNANRLDDVEATNGAQDAAIQDLADIKADKTDLNKETADRIAGDKALSDTIAQNQKDQAKTDAKQNAEINNKVDKSTYAVDKAKQAIHDTIQDAAIVGLAVTKADKADLNKEVSERKKADDVLQSNIDANKADQAVTDARQDQNLSTETDNRVAGDTALQANIDKNKADQAKTDKAQDKVIASKASKKDLAKEAKARQNADAVLQSNIDSEASTRATADTKLQSNIDKETDSRKAADRKLQSNINREANTRAKADAVLSSRIDTNDATLVQHDQRITSNTQRVGAVEQRQQSFENSTNKRFSQMDKKIGDNRKVASAGIAGAGAMANIPQVSQGSTFSVGAGVGGYDSEQAVAVGFSARINNNVVTKMSVSTNTQSELLWGAGVGVEW